MTEERELTRDVSFTVGSKTTKVTETVSVKIQWPGKFSRPEDASSGYVSFGPWTLEPFPAEPKAKRNEAHGDMVPSAPGGQQESPPVVEAGTDNDPETLITRSLSGDWKSVTAVMRKEWGTKYGHIGRGEWSNTLRNILVGQGVVAEPDADFPARHSSMVRKIYDAIVSGRVDAETGKIAE